MPRDAKGHFVPRDQQTPLYAARRPFTYTAHVDLDQGQVTALLGARNDEVLVRLGYLTLLEGGDHAHLVQCGVCGGHFRSERLREAHGDKRHRRPPTDLEVGPGSQGVALVDDTGEAEERRLEREAPLYLDKTQASQR